MSAIYAVLKHTCTIQVGTLSTTADPYHPGSDNRTVSWTSPTSHTGIVGRWQQLSLRDIGEQAGNGMAGTMVTTHFWHMVRSDAPSTLIDHDSTPAPETYHRIVNVKDSQGNTLDAGPFDVQRVLDLAGQNEVIKLELKRVN